MAFDFLKRKRKLVVTVIAVVIVAGGLGYYWFAGKGNSTAQAATVAAKRGTIKVSVSGTGTAEPLVAQSVTAKVSGTITSLNFKNGQRVKKGDLLFELNNQTIQADLTRAQLEQRQAELDRQTTGSQISQQDVRAGISGQVSGIQVTEGQDVQKGAALMTINDTSSMTFQVPVSDPRNISTGQKADVTILDLGAPGLAGTVSKVDRVGKANTDGSRSYYITVKISNPGALTPDMKAQADIHTASGTVSGYEAGVLKWAQTETVRAGVAGTLQRLDVDENDYVNKGRSVGYIRSDSANNQLESQSIKQQQARLNIQDIQRQLADCKVYAPIDGVITIASAVSGGGGSNKQSGSSSSSGTSTGSLWQIGDDVGSGDLLATIDGGTGMAVTIPVDEVDIAKVKVGQKTDITVDALPDKVFRGTVTSIGNQGTVQNSVATFDVTVAIDRPEGIKPGMTANAEIMVDRKDGALLLPIEAVQEMRGKKYVVMSSPDSESGQSEVSQRDRNLRPVETGLYNESEIEIISGIQEGDTVVLPGVTRNNGNGASGGNGGNSSRNNNRNAGPFGGNRNRPGGGLELH